MVSNFRKSSQDWKKRLKHWAYTCTFVAFINITLFFFFPLVVYLFIYFFFLRVSASDQKLEVGMAWEWGYRTCISIWKNCFLESLPWITYYCQEKQVVIKSGLLTLDSGMDYGLDSGLRFEPSFGLMHTWNCQSPNLSVWNSTPGGQALCLRPMQQENGSGFGSVLQLPSLPESIVGSWLVMFVIGQYWYLQHDISTASILVHRSQCN